MQYDEVFENLLLTCCYVGWVCPQMQLYQLELISLSVTAVYHTLISSESLCVCNISYQSIVLSCFYSLCRHDENRLFAYFNSFVLVKLSNVYLIAWSKKNAALFYWFMREQCIFVLAKPEQQGIFYYY